MRLLVWMIAFVAPLVPQAPASVWPRDRPAVFVDLSYPPEALDARVEGAVIVRVTADASGRVVTAEPLLGPERLVPAAIANVKQWTLSPGEKTGVVVFRFEIDYAACNDDRRSLFRLVRPNLAVITACTAPRRGGNVTSMDDDLYVESFGGPGTYPPIARSARIEGAVVLELTLDARGAVVAAQPLSEAPLLTQAAIDHAKRWRYSPPARRRALIVYEFALDRRDCTRSDQEASHFWRVTTHFYRLSGCSPFIEV